MATVAPTPTIAALVGGVTCATHEELNAFLLTLNEKLAGSGMRVVGGSFCDPDAPLDAQPVELRVSAMLDAIKEDAAEEDAIGESCDTAA